MRFPLKEVLCSGEGNNRVIYDLDWDDYRNCFPGLNPSTIAQGTKSMLHLKHTWDNDSEDTDSMIWGRAAHCLLFEPKKFASRYVCWEGRRAGNEYKAFLEENSGKEVLTSKQLEEVQKAAKSLIADPLVKEIIKKGMPEVTLAVTEGNIQCRGRVDWLSKSTDTLVDLKTCVQISATGFGRAFYKYHYDLKLGLYKRWLNFLTKKHWPVQVICLENKAPYDVTVVPVPDMVLERGARKGLEVIAKVERCIRSDVWTGVAEGAEYYLDTPTWEMDDELEGAEEVF